MQNQVEQNMQVNNGSSKKKGKKKWIIILAVLVVLFIAIGSSDSEQAPVVSESPSDNVTQTADTSVSEQALDKIKVGSTVSDKTLKITYKSCNADYKGYNPYADLKDGYKVIQAVFDFENISQTDTSLNGFECYADGVKCDEFFYVDDYSSPTLESVSAGRKLNDAVVYFAVPQNAQSIELEYEYDFWDGDKYIFIVE